VATAVSKYKYNPQDFVNMPSLSEDLSEFYSRLELYESEKTKAAYMDLTYFWWEVLFFTIKHREVEGNIAPHNADDVRNYLEGLIYAS